MRIARKVSEGYNFPKNWRQGNIVVATASVREDGVTPLLIPLGGSGPEGGCLLRRGCKGGWGCLFH